MSSAYIWSDVIWIQLFRQFADRKAINGWPNSANSVLRYFLIFFFQGWISRIMRAKYITQHHAHNKQEGLQNLAWIPYSKTTWNISWDQNFWKAKIKEKFSISFAVNVLRPSTQAFFSSAPQEMRYVACATIHLSTGGNGDWAVTTEKSRDGVFFFNVYDVTRVDLVSMFLRSKLSSRPLS